MSGQGSGPVSAYSRADCSLSTSASFLSYGLLLFNSRPIQFAPKNCMAARTIDYCYYF
jgi:hypothetical protein